MKNLTTLIVLCLGFLCQASPNPKDTIYTNVESLMKEVRTTQKKIATYYLVLKDGEDKEVKVRIDLKQIDCEIPIYKSESFDIKKLMALKEESLIEPNQKLEIIDTKSKEWRRLKNDVSTLTKEHNTLKADTLSLDSTEIAKVEEGLQDKMKDFKKVDAEITKIFNEYEAMMDSLMGNLRTQYHERLVAAMEEAYEKIENKETTFKSVDDDAHIWDIRMDLLKIDATREMKIPRRLEKGEETTERITAGKLYYLLHFAEFGTMFEEEEVKKVFSAIKLWEFHLNPYLVDKQFGLVCDDQYRTQHYINSIVDYENYSGSLTEKDDSKFENIFLEDVQWVSQFNKNLYEGTGCWRDRCCNRAANEILRRSGTGTDRTMQVVIAQSSQQDCGNITMISKEKFEEGINILKTSLKEHKLPVLIGVHHPVKNEYGVYTREVCCGNTPNITNHYVVVTGMGYDNQKQENYFRFYEVGTGRNSHGTSIENKLYVDDDLMIINGKTSYKLDNINHYYTLTEIRKNNGKEY
nr:hypothetical protein [uncultured Allomuricauda sp.]